MLQLLVVGTVGRRVMVSRHIVVSIYSRYLWIVYTCEGRGVALDNIWCVAGLCRGCLRVVNTCV